MPLPSVQSPGFSVRSKVTECIRTATAFSSPSIITPSSLVATCPFLPFQTPQHSVAHFLLRLDDVILLVDIKSPMYFWRNLLWLSSLSCSSFTASIRLKSVTRDSCNALACLPVAKVSPLIRFPGLALDWPLHAQN